MTDVVTGNDDGERDWDLSTKDGWFAMVGAAPRTRPPARSIAELAAMGAGERRRFDQARAGWHANLGPIRTPQVDAVLDGLDEIVGSNQHDGDKVKPAAVLDAAPGLGKTTAAVAFARRFHREQIDLHGDRAGAVGGSWQRVPVAYLPLTSSTTMRSLNALLCRFYGLPAATRGSATHLAHRAAEAVAGCKTRLIVVDDVHFLDMSRHDGREVANHFKWLANTFPVTFVFVGVGLGARGLLAEGLTGADGAFSQTARRWTVLHLGSFEIGTEPGRRTWRALLLTIEQNLALARPHRGVLSQDLSDYLFARSSGHFASLMSLIGRGCYRAIKDGSETLSIDLLDAVRIDQAAETARKHLTAALDAGLLTTTAATNTRPGREGAA
ncbi:ATP-binding protein [Antribacter gilvus]|uniref:ATP-binding protein n=1 Tax=Antribacter gilvus TaxID=2304675 RepID=UPI000F7A1F1A|nr:ATP-binding protein [Antribacter gilvus]